MSKTARRLRPRQVKAARYRVHRDRRVDSLRSAVRPRSNRLRSLRGLRHRTHLGEQRKLSGWSNLSALASRKGLGLFLDTESSSWRSLPRNSASLPHKSELTPIDLRTPQIVRVTVHRRLGHRPQTLAALLRAGLGTHRHPAALHVQKRADAAEDRRSFPSIRVSDGTEAQARAFACHNPGLRSFPLSELMCLSAPHTASS